MGDQPKPPARKRPAAKARTGRPAAAGAASKKPAPGTASKKPAPRRAPRSVEPAVEPAVAPAVVVEPPLPAETPPAKADRFDRLATLVRELVARGSPEEFRRAWRAAATGAGVGLGVALLACVLIVYLADLLVSEGGTADAGVSSVQAGGFLFHASQRVAIVMEAAGVRGEEAFLGAAFRSSYTFAPLGSFLIVVGAFALGGFVAAQTHRGTPRERILAGVRTALPLAAGSLVVAFAFAERTPFDFGDPSGGFTRTHASYVGVVVSALLLGAAAGFVGAAAQVHGRRRLRPMLLEAIERRYAGWAVSVDSTLRALRIAFALVLLAGVCAAVVQIVQHPAGARTVFGSGRNVGLIILALIVGLPSGIAAGTLGSLGIPAAFGGLFVFDGEVSIFGGSARAFEPPPVGISVPRYAIAGLAIAAIATIWMGYRAAHEAGGDDRSRARAALRTAVPFTVACWVLGFFVTASSSAPAFHFQAGFSSEERFQRVSPPAPDFVDPIEPRVGIPSFAPGFGPEFQIPSFVPGVPIVPPTPEPPTFDSGFAPPAGRPPGALAGSTTHVAAAAPLVRRDPSPSRTSAQFGEFPGVGSGLATAGPSSPALLILPILWGIGGSMLGARIALRRPRAHGTIPDEKA